MGDLETSDDATLATGGNAQSAAWRRRSLLVSLFALFAVPAVSRSATVVGPPRIGWLKIQGSRHTPGQLQAFREGMRGLDLIEGRDFVLRESYANSDASRLTDLAAELVRSGVRIIVATSQPSIIAATRVTSTVPVIGRMNDDPVFSGIAQSLARPGGNVTGVYAMTDDLNAKRLSLLKEAVPSLRRVGVLYQPNWSNVKRDWEVALQAAHVLGLELVALGVRSAEDISAAFERASAQQVEGIMTFRNPTVVTHLKLIAGLCLKHRLPAMFDASEYSEAGGLMSYGPNIEAIYRQLATYAAKLLRGIPPRDLPIEQPMVLELVVNMKTANTFGVQIPQSIVVRADKLIKDLT